MKCSLAILLTTATLTLTAGELSSLKPNLTFYASFDRGPDADFAKGDPKLYTAPNLKQPRVGTLGMPTNQYVVIAKGAGKFGDALLFQKKVSDMVFFQAKDNVQYSSNGWNGSVSFWLRLDPETDLDPGYTDPIQITPRDWNDAAFFVEFGKDEKPRHFRLGAYADLKVWNPNNRDWNSIPWAEKPLVSVTNTPFKRTEWTHIAFTFENFNTGKPNGVPKLYLNGNLEGSLTPRVQTFTWDIDKTRIMLGLSYKGFWDELAIFNRVLTPEEVRELTGMASARDLLGR